MISDLFNDINIKEILPYYCKRKYKKRSKRYYKDYYKNVDIFMLLPESIFMTRFLMRRLNNAFSHRI